MTKWHGQDTIPTEAYVKAPKVGQWIAGPTGPEVVIGVFNPTDQSSWGINDPGADIGTIDTIGRYWLRTRSEHGWWTVVPSPEITP